MNFRDATTEDVDAIVVLVESAYRGDASRVGWTTEADLLEGQRTDAAAINELIVKPESRILLGLDDAGATVACCNLARLASGLCYFGMFAVDPSTQGGGIGRSMLEAAESLARDEWSATAMEMTVITQRRDLIDWYCRRGYQVTGERRPFPYGDERFGVPRRDDLEFDVLVKSLTD